ncbi:amino acid ABC transporter permease [Aestuariimicrobium sp. p3-SID1156]|uniref:amino acid ABC transporter permease n=1 Tax=Aestuariimicrobium sp. p3-SID1156 TaxID=2916038 RepID=UPI00223B3B61|nr:amino acid ABC transporter permease [Aestuariimicrobium sp. p3-SID1156]MCT1459098.1 amino acid ABC transporter permease [Aestuariimicrobium sp. p3-SID1156]
MFELVKEFNVLQAFGYTILLTVCSALGAFIIGVVVAILRVSPVPALRLFGTAYVNLVRNTPLTIIIFFCISGLMLAMNWYLLPDAASLNWQNFVWAVVGLSVYHAAFVAEAVRSGINTVPLGQAEAARAVGLPFVGTIREVILPQAMRGAIAPLGNTLIALTKNTTVVATVVALEASAVMKKMIEDRPDMLYLTFFIFALGFVLLTLPVGVLFTRLSKKLAVAR